MNNIDDFLKMFPDAKIVELDPHGLVLCDICGENFTNRLDQGGLLFLSNAVCPDCAPSFEASVIKANEQEFIRARCPPGKSFADWVREDARAEGESPKQKIKCRQILLSGVEKMVGQAGIEEISLRLFVDDLSNYGLYLTACEMIERSVPREEMRDLLTKRVDAMIAEAFNNATTGNL